MQKSSRQETGHFLQGLLVFLIVQLNVILEPIEKNQSPRGGQSG